MVCKLYVQRCHFRQVRWGPRCSEHHVALAPNSSSLSNDCFRLPPQDSVTTLLAIHAAATWALVGLIWTVQVVHYPLFAQVGADVFRDYHARHMLRITFLVAPLMLVEVATAVLLLIRCAREPWLLASLVPLLLIWASTWRMQVPLHESLSNGFDVAVHRKLVASNWWRTGAWSVRGGCLLWGLS